MDKPVLTQGRLFIAITSTLCLVLILMIVYLFHSMVEIQRIPPQPYVTIVNNNIAAKAKLLSLKLEIINFQRERSESALAKLKIKARVYRSSILQDFRSKRTMEIHQQFGDVKQLSSINSKLAALATILDEVTLQEGNLKPQMALAQLDKVYSQLNIYLSSFVSSVQKNQMIFAQHKQDFHNKQSIYLTVISACLIMIVGVISWMYLNQRRLSRDLKVRTDKMEEAKKLAEQSANAKARFLANMSHEMRTPLNAVIGLSQAEYYREADGQTRSFIEMINKSGKHLLKLINSVLDLSKIEHGKMKLEHESFYASELIELSKTIFVDMNKPGVEIFFSSSMDKDYQLVADKTKLLQVINNLSYNALKFTDSGYVEVRLAIERSEELSCFKLQVIDTGIGMSKEQLDKVFEEFVQADDSITRRYGGTGLGLSICQSLVSMMNGTLEVQSVSGKGSEFTVSIPVDVAGDKVIHASSSLNQRVAVVSSDKYAQALISAELTRFGLFDPHGEITVHYLQGETGFDPSIVNEAHPTIVIGSFRAAIPESEQIKKLTKPYDIFSLLNAINSGALPEQEGPCQQDKPHSHRLSALIVEDMRVNQIVAEKMLSTLRIDTTTASNGQECIELLEQRHFDIIFMDIQMPVMDGIEALKTIRRENLAPGTAIVALTANNFEKDVMHYLELGFNDVVPKPVRMELMKRVLVRYSSDGSKVG